MKTEIESSTLFKTFTRKNQAHFIEPSDNSDLVHWTNREMEDQNFAAMIAGAPVSKEIISEEIIRSENIDAHVGSEEEDAERQAENNSSFQSLYARFSSDPLFRDEQFRLTQVQNTYIICETNGGFLLIHQQAAHERVLYEKFILALSGKPLATQPGLFPHTLTLSTSDAVLLQELLPGLHALGYSIEPFGKDSFIIQEYLPVTKMEIRKRSLKIYWSIVSIQAVKKLIRSRKK